MPAPSFELQETTLHGHRVAYRLAGQGPAIVLVHGVTSTSATWESVGSRLARRHTVLAPDLLGHGSSAKPRGDYSMGAFASGVRDLMLAIGIERATFVGHSLGGGIAMQLAYQFPERCERLALVSSGGLGSEVSLLLRAATLPGSELAILLLANRRVLDAGRQLGRVLGRLGLRAATDIEEVARGHASLQDPEARSAFVHTLRASIDPWGQRVSARDRLYLARQLPFLLVWGERDRIIPADHGRAAKRSVPSARLELFRGAGHFPHLDDPDRFIELVTDFVAETEPAEVDMERVRRMMLRAGPVPSRRPKLRATA